MIFGEIYSRLTDRKILKFLKNFTKHNKEKRHIKQKETNISNRIMKKSKVVVNEEVSTKEIIPNVLTSSEGLSTLMNNSRNEKALSMMKEFVECLYDVFPPKRQSPMGRYKRLLNQVMTSDEEMLNKFIGGFTDFFECNKNLKDVPRASLISYNENIFIPIGKYMETEEVEIIIKHLVMIKLILTGKMDNTSLSEANSAEERFIDEIVSSIETYIKENPFEEGMTITEIVKNLLTSGLLEKIIDSVQERLGDGSMNEVKLLLCMQKALPRLLGRNGAGKKGVNNITSLLPSIFGAGSLKTLE